MNIYPCFYSPWDSESSACKCSTCSKTSNSCFNLKNPKLYNFLLTFMDTQTKLIFPSKYHNKHMFLLISILCTQQSCYCLWSASWWNFVGYFLAEIIRSEMLCLANQKKKKCKWRVTWVLLRTLTKSGILQYIIARKEKNNLMKQGLITWNKQPSANSKIQESV